ncbi:MAG: murein L,D-transpeptidase catalytic domain family protein [Culturomica sp.]|jgi:hypothetical protein|nr:murein L,D-transpeptidase catalytic domain family protein [Culturomica sp.]
MWKKVVLLAGVFVCAFLASGSDVRTTVSVLPEDKELYSALKLSGQIGYTAFHQAMEGYRRIPGRKKEVLTIIDYSKPSDRKRLFVLDLKKRELVYASYVAHGRNSGNRYATSFSNVNGSYKSSLGFYKTENTYRGKNGYSLVLDGLEKGINDHAKERAIVIHGADYADPAVLKSTGRLGRSLGCPALPREVNREIIDYIKEGSLLYIYAVTGDQPQPNS